MPASRHLAVERFCTQIDATIDEIRALPSGINIVRGHQKISRTVQSKLLSELQDVRARAANASADEFSTGASDEDPPSSASHDELSGRKEAQRSPQSIPVPRPPGALAPKPEHAPELTPRPVVSDPGVAAASLPGSRQVREVAQDLPAPVSKVLAALEFVSGQQGWNPNSFIGAELLEPLVEHLKQAAPSPTHRSAGAARVAKVRRSMEELNALRICVLSERLTPGEQYLAEALRGLDGCVAFIGPHAPKDSHPLYGQTIEIDAIVMTPTFLAVVEVKDTKASGLVKPALNGTWMVGDQALHDGNSFPTDQVLRQAKVLKGLMKDLSGMPRIPGFVAIHGDGISFSVRPFEVVANGECFASKSTDIVEAIKAYQAKIYPKITVDKVLRVMSVLGLGELQRLNRQELGDLGYRENANAIE